MTAFLAFTRSRSDNLCFCTLLLILFLICTFITLNPILLRTLISFDPLSYSILLSFSPFAIINYFFIFLLSSPMLQIVFPKPIKNLITSDILYAKSISFIFLKLSSKNDFLVFCCHPAYSRKLIIFPFSQITFFLQDLLTKSMRNTIMPLTSKLATYFRLNYAQSMRFLVFYLPRIYS